MKDSIEGAAGRSSEELLPIVYEELRRLAGQRLGQEPAGHTLHATDLVHEAYIRLMGSEQRWEGSAHFFGAAAEAMRRIIVDRARAKRSAKRGGDRNRLELHDSAIEASEAGSAAEEILMVSDLLDRLEQKHPNEAQLAKLRYFADFNTSEAAKVLEIPVSTAHQRWNFARAWLQCEFQKDDMFEGKR